MLTYLAKKTKQHLEGHVNAPLNITPLIDDPELRVWQHAGSSDRLVICFSGIGPDPDALPEHEFTRTATNGGQDWVLYIADPKRSWLNGAGLIERIVQLIEAKAAEIGARQVCTLGHSMGAYSACILPGFTKVDVAMALSPQVSVHPEVVGDDPRWMNYRDQITDFRIRHVGDHLSADTQYHVLFGMAGREAPQRDRFPVAENIEQLHMAKTHHNTAQRLKARGILDTVVGLAFDGRIYRVRRLIRRNFDGVLVGGRREASASHPATEAGV